MNPVQDQVSSPNDRGVQQRGGDAHLGWDDARVCRRIVSRHARTFWIASRLLPAAKRRATFAVYATCRTADDIVDTGHGRESDRALAEFREAAFESLEHPSPSPILRELSRAMHDYDVPVLALRELFDALERDLVPFEIRNWVDLQRYCEGVAGSVGAMCCAIFGAANDQNRRGEVSSLARTLGVAMQLTNILRDVGEDARRGRCYLPTEELARFGLDRESILSGAMLRRRDEWRAFMTFQVDRARHLYRQALPGIPLLQHDARRCAMACATGYATILDAIVDADFDTWSRRVSASRLTLLAVAWQSWRSTAAGSPDASTEPASTRQAGP
jgi:phytoene synthase